jgi:hypothetical protein
MPLAAITPLLNDLLHKGSSGPGSSSQNQSLQQLSISNDSPTSSEYLPKGSIIGQSTSATNPLRTSSIDDVSI